MKFHTIWPSYLLTYMHCILCNHIYHKKKLQHNFPKMRGEGQRPFEIFPKIHPIWRSHPSLTNMQDRRNIAIKHLGGQIPSHRALSSPWYFVSQIICLANSLEIRNYTRFRKTREVRRYPACISVSHAAMSPRRTCSRTEANGIVGNPCPHFLRCDKLLG